MTIALIGAILWIGFAVFALPVEAAEPAKPLAAASSSSTYAATPEDAAVLPDPKEATSEEQAAFLHKSDADRAAAAAALKGLATPPSADNVARAQVLIDEYCQDVVGLGRLAVATNEKLRHCRSAIQLAEDTKLRSEENAEVPVASLKHVQALESILKSPREQLKSRFSQARDLYNKADYANAAKLLSSLIGIPEVPEQRSLRMLRAMCSSNLQDWDAATSDFRKVVDNYHDDSLARRALYLLGYYEMILQQYDRADADLSAVIVHYTPSGESGKAQIALQWLHKVWKPRGQQPASDPK